MKPVSMPGAWPLQGGVPLLAHYFDAGSYDVDGEIVMWEWQFGDGQGWQNHTVTQGTTWFNYNKPGNKVAHLRVTDNEGNKDVGHITIKLRSGNNSNPLANASANPVAGCAPLQVAFSAAGSYDPDGEIVSWMWDFNTGIGFEDFTDTEGTASYEYVVGRTYTAVLQVTDCVGAISTAGVTIEVNEPPVAVASASPEAGPAPLEVVFSDGGSFDLDGEIVMWEWDFGEGAGFHEFISSQGSATYTYEIPGPYIATLRVTDQAGCTATASLDISVEEPETGWVHTWGDEDYDLAIGMDLDAEGNVYLCGSSGPLGSTQVDALVMRYGPDGALHYAKEWGGAHFDRARSMVVTSTGLVYTVGDTYSYAVGADDFFLLISDLDGNLISQRTWGGNHYDRPWDIIWDGAESLYLGGIDESFGAHSWDTIMMKLDMNGDVAWTHMWRGGSSYLGDGISRIAFTPSGGIIAVGSTHSAGVGSNDVLLLNYDVNGNLLTKSTWGGSGWDDGQDVVFDEQGNLYVCGYSESYSAGLYDVVLLKYDISGNLLYAKTWGGNLYDMGYQISLNPEGNIILSGHTQSYGHGGYDVFLLTYDLDGNLLDQQVWGTSGDELVYQMHIEEDGAVYIAGSGQDASGSWSTVSGIVGSANGTETSPVGYGYSPSGSETFPAAPLDDTLGVEDLGGGSADVLLIKYYP